MIRTYILVIGLSLLCSIAFASDWLEGGYVSSMHSSNDPALNEMLNWLHHPVPNYHLAGYYPGPYGVYPFSPLAFYSDFRLNSLAGMNWEPFRKNWSETMNYAQTKSSFRTYPTSIYTYPVVQFPPSIAADTPVTIVSQGMRGYQVFLDENYLGTEGTGRDLMDGRFSFSVVGDQNHAIRVYDGRLNYPKTMYFPRGVQKIIYVEPGTAVYI
jgi:hypothetical protein